MRPEVDRRAGADGVAGILIDHEAARVAHGLEHPLGVHHRAELIPLAGDAEIRHADLLGVALPGQRLAEGVELRPRR